MLDREWLEKTVEDVVDPEVEIVDAHHHLFPSAGTRVNYELPEFHADTGSGHNVVATVFIECRARWRQNGPPHLIPVGETEYVAAMARNATQGPPIAAIVSHVNLSLPPQEVAEALDAHVDAGNGLFRGIRHSGALTTDGILTSHTPVAPGLYRTAEFQAGARQLADRGLSFEAWQYHHQLGDVAELAAALPHLSIIVNHMGGPLGVGVWADRWEESLTLASDGLDRLADHPNVVLKLGGIGMDRFATPWPSTVRPPTSDEVVERWGAAIHRAINSFGTSRCMFESNYPVDSESIGYRVLWNAFKKIAAGYDSSDQADLMAGTARRIYRIDS